jgi:hypothetical protein
MTIFSCFVRAEIPPANAVCVPEHFTKYGPGSWPVRRPCKGHRRLDHCFTDSRGALLAELPVLFFLSGHVRALPLRQPGTSELIV